MQEIFEKIKERLMTGYDKESNSPVKKVRLCDAIEIVNQVAEEYGKDTNVPSNDGWIPCSERLPEVNTTYLVSLEGYCKPLMAWFGSDKEWYWYNSPQKMNYVIAWQPLPAPYQPKGE